MTSSKLRSRPRRAGAQVSVRVLHAVLGGATGIVWLVLPGMTTRTDVPVAITRPTAPAASAVSAPAAAPAEDGTSTTDLVLPLVVVGAAGALAGYGYLRRVRRARTRTTPGGVAPSPHAETGVPDEQVRAALVAADDRVRAARDELGFVRELFGPEAVAPFTDALREAETELAAAFRMRQRHDDGVPRDAAARRQAQAGIVGRGAEAVRRLDAAADGFRRLRGLERGVGGALGVAEARFRELTGRTAAAETVLDDMRAAYAATASASVVGYVEQAKDRLVFATVRLNQARQADDSGRPGEAARHLRAAEGAIAQAAVLVEAVERTAAELREAAGLVPAALTDAEARLAPLRDTAGPGDEALTHLLHADTVLSSVRRELTSGRPHDPLGMLRRITTATWRATSGRADAPTSPVRAPGPAGAPANRASASGAAHAPTNPKPASDPTVTRATPPTAPGGTGAPPNPQPAREQAGVAGAAARLTARSATAAADGFVATHRGAVGAAPRTRLAEARRLLAAGDDPGADALALEARALAEQDVRVRGNPYTAPPSAPDAARPAHTAGTAGAVLGGILPADDPENADPAGFAGRPHRTPPG
ncbi:hypothetical protein [Streptomyces sp. NPDC088766]|uniref:hypothetical protein n=1 Tax=Streptomyces sp. NPDC088766 TaxID=3365893 RepID=UPI003821B7B5